jgi:hypothetical protein
MQVEVSLQLQFDALTVNDQVPCLRLQHYQVTCAAEEHAPPLVVALDNAVSSQLGGSQYVSSLCQGLSDTIKLLPRFASKVALNDDQPEQCHLAALVPVEDVHAACQHRAQMARSSSAVRTGLTNVVPSPPLSTQTRSSPDCTTEDTNSGRTVGTDLGLTGPFPPGAACAWQHGWQSQQSSEALGGEPDAGARTCWRLPNPLFGTVAPLQ